MKPLWKEIQPDRVGGPHQEQFLTQSRIQPVQVSVKQYGSRPLTTVSFRLYDEPRFVVCPFITSTSTDAEEIYQNCLSLSQFVSEQMDQDFSEFIMSRILVWIFRYKQLGNEDFLRYLQEADLTTWNRVDRSNRLFLSVKHKSENNVSL